jgi:DNA-directed RNA polymerase subunit M/transcription elongation factor TFIIS
MSGLPIVLNSAKYEVELPISKKTVEYRPYLVKEEKQLMLAIESQDPAMIMKTVQDIIDACTFGEIKSRNLPTAELELLFLKLRSKSVGETSRIGYKCTHCGHSNELVVNLEDVQIDIGEAKPNKVMITDKIGIKLKYPTASEVTKIVNSGEKTDINNIFGLITACIEAIFDEENVYDAKNLTQKEITDFVESLNSKQFENIKEFFEAIPKLRKDVSFTCEKCGTHNPLVLEGLQNFFG